MPPPASVNRLHPAVPAEDAHSSAARASHRREYLLVTLHERDVDPDPIRQFARWFEQARRVTTGEVNAMTLATATPDGIPSARVVLLKDFDERGFVFYSNYESQKGRELAANPRAALVFHWPVLERQVRIAGTVERVTREESRGYFDSRAFASRIGALASRQSEVLPNRQDLEARVRDLTLRYKGSKVPLPPTWGGYRLAPSSLELWQGRPSRLHDRLRYTRAADGAWTIERLSP